MKKDRIRKNRRKSIYKREEYQSRMSLGYTWKDIDKHADGIATFICEAIEVYCHK